MEPKRRIEATVILNSLKDTGRDFGLGIGVVEVLYIDIPSAEEWQQLVSLNNAIDKIKEEQISIELKEIDFSESKVKDA
jgi:hypothetical protein